MSLSAINLENHECVSAKIAEWVRDYSAKELALMFMVEERTARGWRDGNFPQNKHLVAMVERWGLNFLEEIFSPVLDKEISVEVRIERIEHDIHKIKNFRAIASLILIVFSMFGAAFDDNPLLRAPRPAATRVRRDADA